MSALPTAPPRLSTPTLLLVLLAAPLTLGALAHLNPDLAADARQLTPLTLQPSHPSTTQAAGLLVNNLRVVALPLLGALALSGLHRSARLRDVLRALLDAVIGVSLAANLTLLALALAGYGLPRMAPWLAHLPAEFAALAVSLHAYLNARHNAVSPRQLALAMTFCAVALPLAAALETYATPGT